jgi:hypothetical protein
MALVLNGSGSITGLSAGGLPDGSVTADDIASLPAGSVIQVVQEVLTNNDNSGFLLSTNSTSFQSAVLSASITPSSATNKILALVTVATFNNLAVSLYRNGSTNLGDSFAGFARNGSTSYWMFDAFNYLDSPNTTSATSYTVYGKSMDGTTVYIGGDNDTPNTITLMEIAA